MERWRADWVLLGRALVRDRVVEAEGGRITGVREPRSGDAPAQPGLLVPGLVNAHLHLELGWAAGLVPGGDGIFAWASRLMRLPRGAHLGAEGGAAPLDIPRQGHAPGPAGPGNVPSESGSRGRAGAPSTDAQPLVDAGTAVVCDVSNSAATAPALAAAGLAGVVQHELLGFGRAGLPDKLAVAAAPDRSYGLVTVRPSPHAVYSTPPELIRAASRPSAVPATIHLSEDPAERRFTEHGDGPAAELLDALGVDWRWWQAPGLSPVATLDALGVLGRDLLLVHAVDLDDADRALIAARGAPVCLCPRSNLHVGGRLPDVRALLAAGVRLALGTDSLASSPDLDVLGELPVLADAFPEVPVERWLRAATVDGAAILRQGAAQIAPGLAPGLVWLEVDSPEDLRTRSPARRWVARPGGRSG